VCLLFFTVRVFFVEEKWQKKLSPPFFKKKKGQKVVENQKKNISYIRTYTHLFRDA
jgi:hypothetical protein